jgi:hypothetical protein
LSKSAHKADLIKQLLQPKREIMDTKKHLEKMRDIIEDHKEGFDKETLTELGSTALLLLSGFAANKLIRNLVIAAVVVTAGKLAYDYLSGKIEEIEETERA